MEKFDPSHENWGSGQSGQGVGFSGPSVSYLTSTAGSQVFNASALTSIGQSR